jgi:hypothetical protein
LKERIELQHVVLLGRTFEEYCTYFQLTEEDLRSSRILDLAAGLSSFCGEAAARGYDVTAADPVYRLSQDEIARKSDEDLKEVLRQLPGVVHNYKWDFYRNAEGLAHHRKTARLRFLKDYQQQPGRYVCASLPETPFADREFSIVLVSYFLFLYDDLLSYEFHKRSVLEAVRIARKEVRVYPLVNLRAEKSVFVGQLKEDPDCAGLAFDRIKSDFEFVKNSNEMLIIRRA